MSDCINVNCLSFNEDENLNCAVGFKDLEDCRSYVAEPENIQLALEELRAQFEGIYKAIDLRQRSGKYRNDITRMVWSGYHKCAKANNILREG